MAQVLEFDEEMQQRVVTTNNQQFPAFRLISRMQVGLAGKGWLTWLSGSSVRPGDETQVSRYVLGEFGVCIHSGDCRILETCGLSFCSKAQSRRKTTVATLDREIMSRRAIAAARRAYLETLSLLNYFVNLSMNAPQRQINTIMPTAYTSCLYASNNFT